MNILEFPIKPRHILGMIAAEIQVPSSEFPIGTRWVIDYVDSFIVKQVNDLIGLCDAFNRWYRQELLLKKEPDIQAIKCFDESCPRLIQAASLLLTQLHDPRMPYENLARQLESLRWQLEHDWNQLHPTISETEAVAVLKQAFPDDIQSIEKLFSTK